MTKLIWNNMVWWYGFGFAIPSSPIMLRDAAGKLPYLQLLHPIFQLEI